MDNLPQTHLQPGSCKFVCTLESHLSERRVTLQSGWVKFEIFAINTFGGFAFTCRDLMAVKSSVLIQLGEGPCLKRVMVCWFGVRAAIIKA